MMKILELLSATEKLDVPDIPKLTAEQVLAGSLNAIYFIVGGLAVIIIILAGYTFITSSGDPAAVTKAKNAILYSVVGLIVVIMAFAITSFVLGRF